MQGKTINGFVLQRRLGKGGMAEVWYAENEIGMKAAVKIMSEMLAHNPMMQERFLNEAKVMVKLDHPNIRKVYGYGNVDDRPAIIMEYLDGTDLKMKMKSGKHFTEEELERWWNQLADALNYTHAQDVVHRDIKPSNIFIDQHGNAKLLDFGIAKVTDTSTGTQTGSTLGTRIYMSPEQVKDPKRVGTPSDVYSLAVSFVHLLSGEAPYDISTSSDYDIQVSIVTKPVDMSKVPAEWQGFLTPYLNKEADQRPALQHFSATLPETVPADEDGTMADMGQNPEAQPAVQEGEGTLFQTPQKEEPPVKVEPKEPTKVTPTAEPTDKPKSRKGLWIALAAILLAAAAVVVWFLTRDPYKSIDQWISESERIYDKFHIEAPMGDYTLAVDSLNVGYALRGQAFQALEALRLKNPDSLAFALRTRKCDSLDSLYVGNISPIVKTELLQLSILPPDSDTATCIVASLRQLEKSICYKSDGVSQSWEEAIERDMDILLHAELFSFGRKDDSLGVTKYGFIDQLGNIVIEPQFDAINEFCDGFALVRVNNVYHFVNKLGYRVFDSTYTYISSFSEGLAVVSVDGKDGYIDRYGNMVIKPQYYSAGRFSDGMAQVAFNYGQEYYCYIDKTGKVAFKTSLELVHDFSEGRADFIDFRSGRCGYLDKSGNIVYQTNRFYTTAFSEGLAAVGLNKYGFINKSGDLVIALKYDVVGAFSEGLAMVKNNDGYGYINKSGNEVINLKYTSAGSFSDGLAYVKINGKFGYIDHSGNMVIEAKYDNAWSFSKGLAKVRLGDKIYYIDKQGNVVFEW